MVVTAPLTGVAVPLQGVPDPVFAQSLVGPGVAITPVARVQTVLAPIAGRLVKLKPHAFVVQGETGAVLVHLGIDTIQLDGTVSEPIAAEGQLLAAGDPVARWHPELVIEAGLNPVCPVIVLESSSRVVQILAEGPVEAGAPLFSWT
ncbi:PTS sugar transporter subunit IIA [Allorhizocola rhizosphaerae]|uniref:PTS sugar transporter subunit IIA n=1 Tax=Allorhizocola rhizosphaerae TaxID=1872709 RepID=UPI000E3BE258|nr:PTS glucose transporter subunit IIA [Allorhizocola rhizosphaerae]